MGVSGDGPGGVSRMHTPTRYMENLGKRALKGVAQRPRPLCPSVRPSLPPSFARLFYCIFLFVCLGDTFGVSALTWEDWTYVLRFAAPILIVEEVLKVCVHSRRATQRCYHFLFLVLVSIPSSYLLVILLHVAYFTSSCFSFSLVSSLDLFFFPYFFSSFKKCVSSLFWPV